MIIKAAWWAAFFFPPRWDSGTIITVEMVARNEKESLQHNRSRYVGKYAYET